MAEGVWAAKDRVQRHLRLQPQSLKDLVQASRSERFQLVKALGEDRLIR